MATVTVGLTVGNRSIRKHTRTHAGAAGDETIQIDHVVKSSNAHYITFIEGLVIKADGAYAFDVWIGDGTNTHFIIEGTTSTSYVSVIPNTGVSGLNMQELPLLEGCTLSIRAVDVVDGHALSIVEISRQEIEGE